MSARLPLALTCACLVGAALGAAPAGAAPEVIRAEVGDVVHLTIRLDRPVRAAPVVVQRRRAGGGRYETVRTLRLEGARVRAAVRVARPGRYLFRARVRHDGALATSAPVVVRVAPARPPRGEG